ncbi:hypothetical protein FWH09_02130 [Candidatus Saccharibacteria bacterium]|nr:hypothetical protein [Candidatus Saccharibacteria bacterium]
MLDVLNKLKKMRGREPQKMRRGDTIIEVIFAITVFAMVSILTITMMNQGLATGTASLQLTLARQEMDAQAEVIRFIHDAYESERNLPVANRNYTGLWNAITEQIVHEVPRYVSENIPEGAGSCSTDPTDPTSTAFVHNLPSGASGRQFALNTRVIDPNDMNNTIIRNITRFTTTSLFPRVVYGNVLDEAGTDTNEVLVQSAANVVLRVEGLWVTAVQIDPSRLPVIDFHIRACWMSPGRAVATTLGTIVRVYDMDFESR